VTSTSSSALATRRSLGRDQVARRIIPSYDVTGRALVIEDRYPTAHGKDY